MFGWIMILKLIIEEIPSEFSTNKLRVKINSPTA